MRTGDNTLRGAPDALVQRWFEDAQREALKAAIHGRPAERLNELADTLRAECVRRGLLEGPVAA